MKGEQVRPSHEIIHPPVDIHVLPGGQMPIRKTDGAIGYDACIRAIVSPWDMDPENPLLRKTLNTDPKFVLRPGKRVTVGLGFVTRMPFPLFYWVAPRSGLASKHGISITNAPGTVDPDYRGEAGAVVQNNGEQDFILERGMRIVQILFMWACIPVFKEILTHDELLDTERGAGGFGSTGHRPDRDPWVNNPSLAPVPHPGAEGH